jgi:hypothetical protein
VRRCFYVILIGIALLGGSLGPTRASAQATGEIEELEIALWPEYDRPAVLVIYRISLTPSVPLPASVRVPIPAEVGEPFAVAWKNAEGRLLLAEYEREVLGDWAEITVVSESHLAQVEYYADLSREGSIRDFIFQWPDGFGAGNVSYEVLQPLGAEDLIVSPPPEEPTIDEDGLTYLRGSLGDVGGAATFSIEITYSKADETLVVDAFSTPESRPPPTPLAAEGGTPDIAQFLPWLVGGLGALLIFLGGYFYFRMERGAKPRRSLRKPSRAKKASGEEAGVEVDASPVFCHNCGTKASPSDHYCRRCGTPLRH